MATGDTLPTVLALFAVQGLLLAALAGWLRRRSLPPGPVPVPPPVAHPVLPGEALPTGTIVPPVSDARTEAGVYGGRPYQLTRLGNGRQTVGAYALVAGAPAGVVLRRQTGVDRLLDSPAYQVVVGDPAFDRAVLVRGDPATLRVLLDAPTRSRVQAAVEAAVAVADGQGVWVDTDPAVSDTRVAAALDEIVALLDALALPPAAWPARLEAITREDPERTIRLDALTRLEALDPARARALTHDLLADPDPEIAVVAALAVGAEGRPTLHARLDAARSPALWSRALPQLADPAARDTLRRGLAHRDEVTVAAVAGVLGRVGHREDVEALRAVDQGAEAVAAAEEAIRAIQSRLGAAEAGQLSLSADPRAGALSVPNTPAGAVSVPGAGGGRS